MAIYELDGIRPQLAEGVWVAESAEVIGNVRLGKHANIWSQVVIRGDNELVEIGEEVNIQDASVLHSDLGFPLILEKPVSIGHRVMLHGCTIGEGSLIGIGAIILNGAKIGKHCLVGAGALVTEGKEFPDGSMILGSPAKVVKSIPLEQLKKLEYIANHYVENAQRFKRGLKRID